MISTEQPAQDVAIFVPDAGGAGLRLAAQVWGAGEDSGAVVTGEWRAAEALTTYPGGAAT